MFMAPLEVPFDKLGDINVFVYPLIYYGFAHVPVMKILWFFKFIFFLLFL